MDKVQFESRSELQDLMVAIDKYIKQNPDEKKNKTLENFFNCLDVIDMNW